MNQSLSKQSHHRRFKTVMKLVVIIIIRVVTLITGHMQDHAEVDLKTLFLSIWRKCGLNNIIETILSYIFKCHIIFEFSI